MENAELLNKALQEFSSVYTAGKDFVLTETPLVIQEYLNWLVIESVLHLVISGLGALLLVGIGLLVKRVATSTEDSVFRDSYGINETGITAYFLLGIVGLIIFLVICVEGQPVEATKQLLKAKYAPKVLLLDKASELVK